MNGQIGRLSIIAELARTLSVSLVVETGTFRGATTSLLADVFDTAQVESVDVSSRYQAFARMAVGDHERVRFHLGDSGVLLQQCLHHWVAEVESGGVLVYLDAHWGTDLPLRNELAAVTSTAPHAVVIIDDFQVDDDDEYGFDDYGFARLSQGLIRQEVAAAYTFFPSHPGRLETGARRGCIVCTWSQETATALESLASLRGTTTGARNAPKSRRGDGPR